MKLAQPTSRRFGAIALVILSVFLVAGSASAFTPPNGAWKGTTSQDKTITFTVRHHAVVRDFSTVVDGGVVEWSGPDYPFPHQLTVERMTIQGRIFAHDKTTTTYAWTTVSGEFTRKSRAVGALHWSASEVPGPGFAYTPKLTWTAHPR